MTHQNQDIELVEILQATCADGDDPLRALLAHMLERYNQEIKRRTRVVRIFPNEKSCIRLVAALAIETNEEWMARRYLNINQEEASTQSTTDDLAA